MIKDINFDKVTEVALAVVPETDSDKTALWKAYLVNYSEEPLTNVLIASEGYGKKEGKAVKTSRLRHFYENIPAKSFEFLEVLPKNLTGLSNQFWISFRQNEQVYDRKYVFVAESIVTENMVHVPLLDKEGVVIK